MSNTSAWNDPAAAREATNYDNPIPSRELILSTLTQNDRALTAQQLAEIFSLHDDDRQHALQKRLGAMVRDAQLEMDRRGLYQPLNEDQCVEGRVQGHPDGFGFLVTAKDQPDILLTSRQMRLVFDGDTAIELIVCIDAAIREGAPRPEGYAGEMMLYLIHGLLHSSGEDDLTEEAARSMRRREGEVLGELRKTFDFSAIFPE